MNYPYLRKKGNLSSKAFKKLKFYLGILPDLQDLKLHAASIAGATINFPEYGQSVNEQIVLSSQTFNIPVEALIY